MKSLVLGCGLMLGACRPDAGAPRYPSPQPWDPTTSDSDFEEGSDPWEEGEARLSLGIFYEGGASDVLAVDASTRHFYIYEETFGLVASEERAEGLSADELVLTGNPWWGGGVHWDAAEDLSGWSALHVALRSRDTAFDSWSIGMSDGVSETLVDVGAVGFSADGQWYDVTIPLSEFSAQGLNLEAVTVPLLLLGEGGDAGDGVIIDDLYLTAE